MKTIAFPAISCGIYGYPLDKAVKIAVDTTKEFLKNNSSIEKIIFIDINRDIIDLYKKELV